MKKRLLLTGGLGMFGRDAAAIFRESGHEVVPADLPDLDISEKRSVRRWLEDVRPEVVVNAAAYTNVDGAETERDAAFRVNARGAETVAKVCRERGAFLVHLSTDYVFPGEKKEGYLPRDEAGPAISAYGESKLEGERRIAAALPPGRFLICRTQWLYGRNGKNFVDTIARLAAEREFIEIVDDQWGVPTWTKDLAGQLSWLIESGASGFAHAAGGGGPVTWFDFGREIVELLGSKCDVRPMTSEMLERPAKRPRYGWLRNESIPGSLVRHWKESLSTYLEEGKSE
ncbi:MAG TPA: dTDP-4-dehydrorhamnose reductase [Acidobacteriota bacterium]|nr:dTDP-4-dehydrorhamnose reductase [Acidobacteriota bacterium]HQQ46549.1 dTDP-4-dehydrorhamnose reductase [Acidobacteriota bacterium]